MVAAPERAHRAPAPLVPPARGRGPRQLPSWPVTALFAGFPVAWLLGVGSFAVVLLAVPMLVAMVLRGGVRVPRWMWPWAVFLVLVLASAVQVDGIRLVGVALRASNYLAVTVLFVYVYNSGVARTPPRLVVSAVVGFWVFVVVGGYLGLLLPGASFATPLSYVLPGSVLGNSYVQELVVPSFAEVQEPWGATEAFVRPSAPFPYTNGWGCAYALLLPVVLLSLMRARSRDRKSVV